MYNFRLSNNTYLPLLNNGPLGPSSIFFEAGGPLAPGAPGDPSEDQPGGPCGA